MICVRPDIDIAPPACEAYYAISKRNKYEIVPGHLSGMIVNAWCGTPVLVLNVYLDVHDKLGTRSSNILYVIGKWVTRIGLPYVICGDFNNSVETISKLNWLNWQMSATNSNPNCISSSWSRGKLSICSTRVHAKIGVCKPHSKLSNANKWKCSSRSKT